MAHPVTVADETLRGEKSNLRVLDFLTETVTVRELIRERVYEEVREHNATHPDTFRGLVQPTDAEATLNGFRLHTRRPINWETQFEKALRAFESNGFFILVDDRQVESLDETVTIRPGMNVSFVRLVPLVGG